MIEPLHGLAALLTATTVVLVVRSALGPPSRLGPRVRPYTIGSRTALGRSADVKAMASGGRVAGAVVDLFTPMIGSIADAVGRFVDRAGDEVLGRRIVQAGLYPDLSFLERVRAYRVRQLGNLVGWGAGTVVVGLLVGLSTTQNTAFFVLGCVIGATRQQGRLDRAVEDRRARMR